MHFLEPTTWNIFIFFLTHLTNKKTPNRGRNKEKEMAGGLVDMVIVTIAGVGIGQATDVGACMTTSVHD